MIWYNNPLLKTSLQMILKKSNQRIIQMAVTYGSKSYTFGHYTATLQKGPVQDYLKKRTGVTQKGVNIGDVNVLDIRKVFKAVETGKIDRDTLNQILSTVSGVKVDASGNIQENKIVTGIPTIKEVRQDQKKRWINYGEDPREHTQQEVDEAVEEYFDFTTNFDTSYKQSMYEVGEAKLRSDPVAGRLWEAGRKSYRDLMEIKMRLDTIRREARNNALKLEDGE